MFYDTEDLKDGEIQLRLERTAEGNPEKNWVPAYYFGICLADGTRIGQCDLRIGHNDRLYIGGNIGYGIDEGYRGHRYAAKACRLLFRQARKHGLGYVIITCDPTNTASSRTCELEPLHDPGRHEGAGGGKDRQGRRRDYLPRRPCGGARTRCGFRDPRNEGRNGTDH